MGKYYFITDDGTYHYKNKYSSRTFSLVDVVNDYNKQYEIKEALSHEYYMLQKEYIKTIFKELTVTLSIKSLKYYINDFKNSNKEFMEAYERFLNNSKYCFDCKGTGKVYIADCSNPYDMHDYSLRTCKYCGGKGTSDWPLNRIEFYLRPLYIEKDYSTLYEIFGKNKKDIVKDALEVYFEKYFKILKY